MEIVYTDRFEKFIDFELLQHLLRHAHVVFKKFESIPLDELYALAFSDKQKNYFVIDTMPIMEDFLGASSPLINAASFKTNYILFDTGYKYKDIQNQKFHDDCLKKIAKCDSFIYKTLPDIAQHIHSIVHQLR